MKCNNENYLYRKNAQGDITHILDNAGMVVAKYIYDAWGNHAILDANGNDLASGVGILNPFRYRSYYYDEETDLYYLQTRYYDPELGRFISQDDVSYLAPDNINGLNLYAYCSNNPVMNVDPTGTTEWWQWLAGAFAVVGVALVLAAVSVLTFGVGAALAGTFVGAVIYGAAQGIVIGAAIGVVAGGLIGGAVTGWTPEGILVGMGIGFGAGAIIGGIIGGFVGASSFTANSAYITKYGGNVKEVLSAFKGNPKLSNISKGTKVFRVHGGKARILGNWVSPKVYSDPVSKLALNPAWGNNASNISTLVFNQNAQVLVGKAAAQGVLRGGGIQWFVGNIKWLTIVL